MGKSAVRTCLGLVVGFCGITLAYAGPLDKINTRIDPSWFRVDPEEKFEKYLWQTQSKNIDALAYIVGSLVWDAPRLACSSVGIGSPYLIPGEPNGEACMNSMRRCPRPRTAAELAKLTSMLNTMRGNLPGVCADFGDLLGRFSDEISTSPYFKDSPAINDADPNPANWTVDPANAWMLDSYVMVPRALRREIHALLKKAWAPLPKSCAVGAGSYVGGTLIAKPADPEYTYATPYTVAATQGFYDCAIQARPAYQADGVTPETQANLANPITGLPLGSGPHAGTGFFLAAPTTPATNFIPRDRGPSGRCVQFTREYAQTTPDHWKEKRIFFDRNPCESAGAQSFGQLDQAGGTWPTLQRNLLRKRMLLPGDSAEVGVGNQLKISRAESHAYIFIPNIDVEADRGFFRTRRVGVEQEAVVDLNLFAQQVIPAPLAQTQAWLGGGSLGQLLAARLGQWWGVGADATVGSLINVKKMVAAGLYTEILDRAVYVNSYAEPFRRTVKFVPDPAGPTPFVRPYVNLASNEDVPQTLWAYTVQDPGVANGLFDPDNGSLPGSANRKTCQSYPISTIALHGRLGFLDRLEGDVGRYSGMVFRQAREKDVSYLDSGPLAVLPAQDKFAIRSAMVSQVYHLHARRSTMVIPALDDIWFLRFMVGDEVTYSESALAWNVTNVVSGAGQNPAFYQATSTSPSKDGLHATFPFSRQYAPIHGEDHLAASETPAACGGVGSQMVGFCDDSPSGGLFNLALGLPPSVVAGTQILGDNVTVPASRNLAYPRGAQLLEVGRIPVREFWSPDPPSDKTGMYQAAMCNKSDVLIGLGLNRRNFGYLRFPTEPTPPTETNSQKMCVRSLVTKAVRRMGPDAGAEENKIVRGMIGQPLSDQSETSAGYVGGSMMCYDDPMIFKAQKTFPVGDPNGFKTLKFRYLRAPQVNASVDAHPGASHTVNLDGASLMLEASAMGSRPSPLQSFTLEPLNFFQSSLTSTAPLGIQTPMTVPVRSWELGNPEVHRDTPWERCQNPNTEIMARGFPASICVAPRFGGADPYDPAFRTLAWNPKAIPTVYARCAKFKVPMENPVARLGPMLQPVRDYLSQLLIENAYGNPYAGGANPPWAPLNLNSANSYGAPFPACGYGP